MHTVYIIYSPSLDKFYVGESVHAEERLKQHNSGHYHNSFTKIAYDWSLQLVLYCDDLKHAKLVENHIKSMKSKKYIQNLLKYPEMQEKLLDRFK